MKKLITLSILMMFSATASASYLKECGTGHVLAGDAMGGYAAVTLNISSSTSDASTSRLSTPELCGKSLWSAARFIDTNLPLIEQDTASGGGEHLVAMLDMLGCEESARASVVHGIRSEFTQSVLDSGYSKLSHQEKVESYFNIMSKEVSKTSSQCKAV